MINRRAFIHRAGKGLLAASFSASTSHAATPLPDSIDRTGKIDSARALNQLFQSFSKVELPAGRYRIESEPLLLRDGFELTGPANAELIKSSPPDTPMILGHAVSRIRISGLSLVNEFRDVRRIVLPPDERGFSVGIRLPWQHPSLTLHRIDAGLRTALQYGEDFRLRRSVGTNLLELDDRSPRTEEAEFEYFVEPGLSPLIALESCFDIAIEDVRCEDGAIVYIGSDGFEANVTISGCKIDRGQIRLEGESNKIPPMMDARLVDPDVRGPRGFKVARNTIVGPLSTNVERRYLKFTERVHGIFLSGGVEDFAIVRNSVTSVAGDGIWLQYGINGTVERNDISGNGLSGIGLENVLTPPSRGLIIRNNQAANNWFDGCDFNYGDPRFKTRVQIQSPERGELADIELVDNDFLNNGQDMPELSGGCGIYARWVKGAEFRGNRCHGNNLGGVVGEISSNLRIERNSCADNGRTAKVGERIGAGIGLYGCTATELRRNRAPVAGAQRHGIERATWRGTCSDGPVEVLDG